MKKPQNDPNFIFARNIIRVALSRQVEDYLTREFNPDLPVAVNRSILVDPIIQIYLKIAGGAAMSAYQTVQVKAIAATDFLQERWRNEINGYAKDYAYRISNKLSHTTKETIQRAIEQGKADKLNNTELSGFIRAQTNEINEARANNIARTESTTASNYGKEVGAYTYFKGTGERGYKYWVHGRSKEPRASHLEAAKKKPIPIDQPFNVDGELMFFPGDTIASAKHRCNCTCTVNYISEALYNRRYGSAPDSPTAPAPVRKPRKPKPVPGTATTPAAPLDPNAPIKTLKEGKARALDIMRRNTNLRIKDGVKVAADMPVERLNSYLDHLEKLTSEYNIKEAGAGEIELLFKSKPSTPYRSGYYGAVKPAPGYRGLDWMNFGDNFAAWGDARDVSLGLNRFKSAVDKANAHLATITHEFAHVISISDYARLSSASARTTSFWREISQLKKDYHFDLVRAGAKGKEKIYLGGYASTNESEFMAEAFTEYMLKKDPSKYAKLVGETIDKYFKK